MIHPQLTLAMILLCGSPILLHGNRSEGLRNLKIGQAFPAFRLETTGGKSITNQDIKGKPAVILYLSSEQRGSERAANEAHRILGKFQGKVVVIYATAAPLSLGYFQKLWKRLNIAEPLGLDQKRALYGKLGLVVFPTTMVIDKKGKLSHVITERGGGYAKTLDAYLRYETGEWTQKKLVEVLKAKDPLLRTPKSMASRYRVSARLLWKKGLLVSAEKELRKALALSPKEAEIQLDLAELLLEQKKAKEALSVILTLRKLWPRHRRAQVVHGIVLYRMKQMKKAKELLLASLPLNPEPSAVHYFLGRIYESEGDKDKALEHYRKAAQGLIRDF